MTAQMSDSKSAAIREKIVKLLDEFDSDLELLDEEDFTHAQSLLEAKNLGLEYADAILALLAQEVKRVIGEDDKDETEPGEKINKVEYLRWIRDRNILRAEQRERLG